MVVIYLDHVQNCLEMIPTKALLFVQLFVIHFPPSWLKSTSAQSKGSKKVKSVFSIKKKRKKVGIFILLFDRIKFSSYYKLEATNKNRFKDCCRQQTTISFEIKFEAIWRCLFEYRFIHFKVGKWKCRKDAESCSLVSIKHFRRFLRHFIYF